MAKNDKNTNSTTQPYIKVGKKQVQTTKEQARASMQAQWREQKVQEREQKCLTETGARCTKDCSKCDNERQSIVGSLDAMQAAGFNPAADFDLEELVAERILFAELAKALGELDPQNRQIMEMVSEALKGTEFDDWKVVAGRSNRKYSDENAVAEAVTATGADPYEHNRGIACGLNNLQKIRDGEPLGGKSRAEDDFADDDDFLS